MAALHAGISGFVFRDARAFRAWLVEAASQKSLLLQAICEHKYLLCFWKVPGMRAETPLPFLCRRAAKLRSKKLPARIWPKTAVSQWSQKRNSIAGQGTAKLQKSSSKKLPARIWPKTGVSQWFQKALLIASLQAAKVPKSGPKRLLAKMAQNGRFPMIPEGAFNCRPASRQGPKISLQKASGHFL